LDPDNEGNVRDNLFNLGYREDLTKFDEPLAPQPDNLFQERKEIEEMPRFKLSSVQENFNTLFSLLGVVGQVSLEAWKLLRTATTNPVLLEKF